MGKSYGDVSLLQGSADSRMHTRFQEIPPDVKVPLIRISANVVTMPSKKKHQATDRIACPEIPFNFRHRNPAVHAGAMECSRMSYIQLFKTYYIVSAMPQCVICNTILFLNNYARHC
jgi:hypothetical protein